MPTAREPNGRDLPRRRTQWPASELAAEVKALVQRGERDAARELFGALVALLQRRAIRVAFTIFATRLMRTKRCRTHL